MSAQGRQLPLGAEVAGSRFTPITGSLPKLIDWLKGANCGLSRSRCFSTHSRKPSLRGGGGPFFIFGQVGSLLRQRLCDDVILLNKDQGTKGIHYFGVNSMQFAQPLVRL
jgi:hypothetical protein